MLKVTLLLVSLIKNVCSVNVYQQQQLKSRRSILLLTTKTSTLLPSLPAFAARGAAELDAEYYFRALLKLDRDRDIFDRRRPRISIEPLKTRFVDESFARAIFSDASYCLSKWGGKWIPPESIVTSDVATDACRDFYETAVNVLQSKEQRQNFANDFGDSLFERVSLSLQKQDLKSLRFGAQAIVNTWNSYGWIDSGSVVRFEDDDDQDDTPRPLQVELKFPVTAPAAAQLEQSGIIWHPSFVGLSLATFFRRTLSLPSPCPFQEYLLDDTYRSDPRAFQASSTLLIFPFE
mmetsp:Transcript_12592/g.16946  ORF Transcript_12592/g.16946 Transcript_12592/m.16946 type:complete len:291 (+) Transcript_12592:1942-2814(+)|eukprot:CAMPEP_0197301980 /NCGR_PEP_ID=MMETSP0890-20130614/50753_1 /TAXON_ID=44058 ORGANISM="Aureoumbra lagunensis, Strain CCMP1510" /NCGR_SAMPLE_ID=MMETSP0890 /ASSEMBLY_ACC=CAM_ASM_000533 /LENGTH=290 /DNA_ID=CAMNT_0042781453 /DNA_START=1941 /DNA_END=2813 /DNA_ORIENTATION=+